MSVEVSLSAAEFAALIRVQRTVREGVGFEAAAGTILGELSKQLGVNGGFVGLVSGDGSSLIVVSSLGDSNLDPAVALPIRGGLREAVESRSVVVDAGAGQTSGDSVAGCLLFQPIVVGGTAVGVLWLSRGTGFGGRDLVISEVFCGELALAFELSRLRSSMRDTEYSARLRLWEEIGKISSELAHDMRGPLQMITNSVFLLERKPAEKEVYIEKINGALAHATALLDGFREYYRGHELQRVAGNVNRVVERALEEVQFPEGVRVERRLDPSVPDSLLDLNKVHRAFWQVAKNGVEAMLSGGVLGVESEATPSEIIVRFSDTGLGIPENVQAKMFEPFGAKKRGGLGLGLAASKRVIEAHGGSIGFKSEPGKGTTFTVRLPRN